MYVHYITVLNEQAFDHHQLCQVSHAHCLNEGYHVMYKHVQKCAALGNTEGHAHPILNVKIEHRVERRIDNELPGLL